ncbi:MAG: PAS domain S-box protein, partial [Burkholderiales bacterium]|nr:PAS domain S-box protein [Opitutaceae bacterium]
HAEAALRESVERYHTLFRSIDEAFCVIDLIFDRRKKPVDFLFLEVNPTFEKHTGLVDATGRRMRELVPELEEHWFAIFGRVALTGEPERFVHEAREMGGRWFDAYACRFGGPESRKVAVVLNDISERRQSDEMLRQSHLALQSHADELGRFNRVAVGRDLRMIDLKKEVNELCLLRGEPARYRLDGEADEPPAVDPAATLAVSAPVFLSTTESANDPPRLLIAEDDPVTREYLLRLLGPHYQVEPVVDGEAALERVLANPPDILLTDVTMPRLDGLGLVRRLRADERTRGIPIVMLSGRASEEAREEGMLTGADDYLIKPFNPRELLTRLRAQLELARLRRENDRHHHEKNSELARRVAELQRANAETQDARRAALNVMEDALESRRSAEALTVRVIESEERYRTLFTSIDEGYCVIEMITSRGGRPLDYRFLEVNPAFERQSGLIDARGKRILELVPDIDSHWIRSYGKIARSGEPLRFIADVKALDRVFDIYACPVGGKGSGKLALIFNDITERRKVEERLRVSEVRYRRLFEAALDGVLLLDPATRKITDSNPFMSNLLGYTHEELVGKELFEIGLLKDEAASQAMVRKLKRKGQVRYEDLPLQREDGRHQDVEVVANLYQEDGRTVIQCNIRDITARKRAEETQRGLVVMTASNVKLKKEIVRRRAVEAALTKSERRARLLLAQARALQQKLRDLSRRMMGVEEEQRKKISRELHDDISQLLVGIIVHLANVTKAATLDPDSIQKTLTPLRRMVEESIRVVHRFARELRPAMLDDLGLVPALESYIHDFPEAKGRRIEFTAFTGVESLDAEKRTMLYRVAQEALTNMAKHSHAKLVRVKLSKTHGRVRLEVSDDGRSFDVRRIASPEW